MIIGENRPILQSEAFKRLEHTSYLKKPPAGGGQLFRQSNAQFWADTFYFVNPLDINPFCLLFVRRAIAMLPETIRIRYKTKSPSVLSSPV